MMTKSIDGENSAQTSHFLGVDFGKAKIGLALADEETRMAFAYDTLKNDKDFLDKLREIIEKENVKTIIIGITRHEKDQKSADEKVAFGEKVEKELGIAVMFEDEMFTTKMAQENIKMRGGRNISQTDDKEAARIILQSWLDRNVQASIVRTSSHVS
jgi:putative Holliday junction resolvase